MELVELGAVVCDAGVAAKWLDTPSVLGVEVGGGQDESAVCERAGLGQYALPVLSPEAGVDDQRCVPADEDADIRDQRDVTVAQHVDAGGNLHRWILGDQRRTRQARDVFVLICQ